MKVMIAFPPLEGHGTPLLGQNRQFQWFHNPSFIYPMVPASAATLLKAHGHQVVWADAIAERRTREEFFAWVDRERPDLIAMETKTPVVRQHWALIALLKERLHTCKFVLMGDHVTALPQESLENSRVDYVLSGGNYDLILDRLVAALESGERLPAGVWHIPGGRLEFTGEPPAADLNALPFIDRDLTKWTLYGEKFYKHPPFTYTMVGRDCPWGKCTFCSWTTLYPKFAVRTPESLLDEIGQLIERYGVREIFDDTGTFPGAGWLKTFCAGMVERGYHKKILFSCNFRFDYLRPELARAMKQAGFRLLKLGLESANQASLDRLCKGTKVEQIEAGCRIAKAAGLEVHLTIMVGHPWETRADAQNTLALARRLLDAGLADMLQSTIMVPYPGTPLYAEAVKQGWLRFAPGEWERWDMTETALTTPDMSPAEVMEMCNQVYRAFLTPRFLARQVAGIRDWEDLKFVARAGQAVVGHIRDFMRGGKP
jgi:anaerobic magnesium-protoporphyrin IX monomethyl ester cyclase